MSPWSTFDLKSVILNTQDHVSLISRAWDSQEFAVDLWAPVQPQLWVLAVDLAMEPRHLLMSRCGDEFLQLRSLADDSLLQSRTLPHDKHSYQTAPVLHHKCAFICLMQHRGGINVFTVAENVQKLTAAKTKCVKVVVTSETWNIHNFFYSRNLTHWLKCVQQIKSKMGLYLLGTGWK